MLSSLPYLEFSVDKQGQMGDMGGGGTSSSRFYKGLLTIGFTTGLNDIRGAGLVQTGGCESGPLLLSKMPAGHTATVALNGVSGVPAPCSCAIVMPQIKSVCRGNLNMGSLRALHPLRETQMHSAGSFSAVAHSCQEQNCKAEKTVNPPRICLMGTCNECPRSNVGPVAPLQMATPTLCL